MFRALSESKSQAYQESFVQNVLNFKDSGFFLEIGAGDGIEASNTLLLEEQFKWTGLSVELNPKLHLDFLHSRKTICICEDATVWDSHSYLKSYSFPNRIDYLQIDIDPAQQSLKALINLPLSSYRFSVITFEHDYYVNQNPEVRDASREILHSAGYYLFFGGVQTHGRNFEDWWLDRDVPEFKKYLDFKFENREAGELFLDS
jgi:hypothetical protein